MLQSALKSSVRSSLRVRFTPRLLNIRFNSTAAASTETIDPKISTIVESISKLSLLETSLLIKELKVKLDIPEMSFPVAGAINPAGANASDSKDSGEAPAEAAAEKTVFNIKLESFDAKTKAKVIKEVKSLLSLSLVDSKKFVESAPKILKENIAKEEAEKIKSTLEGLGAKIILE